MDDIIIHAELYVRLIIILTIIINLYFNWDVVRLNNKSNGLIQDFVNLLLNFAQLFIKHSNYHFINYY